MAMQHTPLVMSRLIDRGATVAPDVEVVTATQGGPRRQSLAQTRDRAHQLAHALYDYGIRPGDRIGTFMWNGSRHLEAYHAAAGMGAVLHTINLRLSPDDLAYIIGHAQDRLIIADADTLPILESLKGRLPSVELVVVAVEEGFEDWTTGVAPAADVVPMFHAMGWGVPWSALMLGCKQVLPHRFMDPERLVELMAREKVSLSAAVPTIWQGVKAVIEANPDAYDLSSLSRLTCGGSAPPKSLIRWYHDALGVEMIQGWGLTETSPLATLSRRLMKHKHPSLSLDEQLENVGKAGQLMPGLEVGIFDEDFNRLPHDGETVGEILIRGPWICSAYYEDPRPERFHGDWLITGDVGTIDPEEYLIIADRSKDLVKSGGEWISSVDLENHIVALDGIAQACVVAQPHPKWDERPVALIVLTDGAEVSPDAILEHCTGRFAKWQLPDDVLFVDSVPLTSTGKMDKKVVRADLAGKGYVLPDLR